MFIFRMCKCVPFWS